MMSSNGVREPSRFAERSADSLGDLGVQFVEFDGFA
jgi:hypothetical protein